MTRICSLYGRAVELHGEPIDKAARHRHLSGPKGFWNLGAVDAIGFEEPLVICEGSFSALAFIASGHRRTLAVYGVQNAMSRLNWLSGGVKNVCVAFDVDEAGEEQTRQVREALTIIVKVPTYYTAEDYGGENDPADAYRAGTLVLPSAELVA